MPLIAFDLLADRADDNTLDLNIERKLITNGISLFKIDHGQAPAGVIYAQPSEEDYDEPDADNIEVYAAQINGIKVTESHVEVTGDQISYLTLPFNKQAELRPFTGYGRNYTDHNGIKKIILLYNLGENGEKAIRPELN